MTDGINKEYTELNLHVFLVTQSMLESAIILKLQDTSEIQFLSSVGQFRVFIQVQISNKKWYSEHILLIFIFIIFNNKLLSYQAIPFKYNINMCNKIIQHKYSHVLFRRLLPLYW